jgi:hypothetical protein
LKSQHFPVQGMNSSDQSIDQLPLRALQPFISQLRQPVGIGLAFRQSMQNAKPARTQQIADDNGQLGTEKDSVKSWKFLGVLKKQFHDRWKCVADRYTRSCQYPADNH